MPGLPLCSRLDDYLEHGSWTQPVFPWRLMDEGDIYPMLRGVNIVRKDSRCGQKAVAGNPYYTKDSPHKGWYIPGQCQPGSPYYCCSLLGYCTDPQGNVKPRDDLPPPPRPRRKKWRPTIEEDADTVLDASKMDDAKANATQSAKAAEDGDDEAVDDSVVAADHARIASSAPAGLVDEEDDALPPGALDGSHKKHSRHLLQSDAVGAKRISLEAAAMMASQPFNTEPCCEGCTNYRDIVYARTAAYRGHDRALKQDCDLPLYEVSA